MYSQEVAACPELPPRRVEPPDDNYHYIKASHTTVISGMAGEHSIIKSVFDTASDTDPNDPNKITLSEDLHLTQLLPGSNIMPKEISPEVQQILIKKFLANAGNFKQEDKDTLDKAKPEQ